MFCGGGERGYPPHPTNRLIMAGLISTPEIPGKPGAGTGPGQYPEEPPSHLPDPLRPPPPNWNKQPDSYRNGYESCTGGLRPQTPGRD